MADEAKVETTAPEGGKTVPYDRFQTVVGAKNQLAAKVTDLEGQVQALTEKAATVDTIAGQVAEWKGKAEAAEARFGTYRTISGTLGTTDSDAIEAAEWQWSRLPEDSRPEIGEWLGTLKADPSKAPKVLHPWLAPQSPDAGSGQPAPPTATPQPPRGTGSGAQAPGAPAQVSADEIRRARDHGVATGDWSRYKALAKSAGYRK